MASGAPTIPESTIDADNVGTLSTVVQAFVDGPELILNGTAEAVYAQLKEINPNYDADWDGIGDSENTDLDDARTLDYTLHCTFHLAVPGNYIKQGIKYLRKVKGSPRLSAGPNECGRVSCSYNAAIYWCNDDTKPRSLPSFNNIADGAQVILTYCGHDSSKERFAGALHHPDLWRAVVQRDKC
ncbi:hypothetical protein BJY01DRAFT_255602 [Aspergillus pseudoustus]|uniref:Uncharacterized protein n=1 Tax=Aspergillus pseudoustus TaxID=1810923 RepID=A0ABR4IIU4_9EURO